MNIVKKELKERQFTPYQITITIESEAEHNGLVDDLKHLREKDNYLFSRLRRPNIQKLVDIILSHIK